MALTPENLEQTITIRTVHEKGGVGVHTDVEPGFPDDADDDEFLAKTLISVLWNVFPDALVPELRDYLDSAAKLAAPESE